MANAKMRVIEQGRYEIIWTSAETAMVKVYPAECSECAIQKLQLGRDAQIRVDGVVSKLRKDNIKRYGVADIKYDTDTQQIILITFVGY